MPFNADPFISKTPGFPKPGITFYDISPILEDAAALGQTMDALSELVRPMAPEIIVGVDARGFLFARRCPWNAASPGKLGELFEQSMRWNMARPAFRSVRAARADDLLSMEWRHALHHRTDRACGGAANLTKSDMAAPAAARQFHGGA